MQLKVIQVELNLLKGFSVNHLREHIINELCKYGEPLRWAITGVESSTQSTSYKILKVEAVVIIL